MNKILFLVFFASVSFSAITEASAGKQLLEEKEEKKQGGVQKKCPPIPRKQGKFVFNETEQKKLLNSFKKHGAQIENNCYLEIARTGKVEDQKSQAAKINALHHYR